MRAMGLAKLGLFLVISDDPELASTLLHLKPKNMELKVWLPKSSSNKLNSHNLEDISQEDIFIQGDISRSDFFKQWSIYKVVCVVLSLGNYDKYMLLKDKIQSDLPDAKILTLKLNDSSEGLKDNAQNERELVISWPSLLKRPIQAALRSLLTVHKIQELRELCMEKDKIALFLQPDPDPDGLASALAVRSVLGRNKLSSPIVSFGNVTRPENLAMLKLLDIEVFTISPIELKDFDKVILIDTQPSHFKVKLEKVDAVIDHHPMGDDYHEVPFVDIRPSYGATSSLLTEYLNAASVSIGQRLATALLYGIKTDTLHLNREVIDADLDAFVFLYPKINLSLLRKIEKPEIPKNFAPMLAKALKNMSYKENLLVTCLGKVQREDLIPQIADFLMQFEDVDWVVCFGFFENDIVASIRCYPNQKKAGEVVKKIVMGWAQGGGHKTMAKAIFNKDDWAEKYGKVNENDVKDKLLELFNKELQS